MYIAIAGNIGSGKTTLTKMLEEHYGAKPYYEDLTNPYLDDFYEDMNRWSFNLQAYFLATRIEQTQLMIADLSSSQVKSHIIQDRTIYEDAEVFARNLNEMGLMSTRDFNTYYMNFELFSRQIPTPDLLIYLHGSVKKLREQIVKRGREYELNIEKEYLERLNEKYNNWIEGYEGRILFVDVDREDFESDSAAFERIYRNIDKIDSNLERG